MSWLLLPSLSEQWDHSGFALSLRRGTRRLSRSQPPAPNDAGIWRSRGDMLTALERTQEAQQAYDKAWQLDSKEDA
jgi:Flp pilus assembly protein TadD